MIGQPNATDPTMDETLDTPVADINAIGATEKAFPIWIFIIGGFTLILLLVAAVFFIQSSPPFLTTAKKEDAPVQVAADPTASTPKLNPAEPTITVVGTLPTISPEASSPVPLKPKSVPTFTGNGPCPTTIVFGADKKPILDPTGVPLAIDCKGVISPSRAASPPPVIVPSTQTTHGAAAVVESGDRYHGEIIIAKQIKPTNLANIGMPGSSTTMPTLPSPPPGAADILRQLEALQKGQAMPSTQINPILSSPNPAAKNGVGNTQGNPNAMLAADKTDRVFAAKTIDENTVIPKGTPIDCSLTTRLVTEISGFAACQVSRDVYSANGRVLLIERMSILDGEYASVSQAGQRYIHVLWTRLRKPGGITIDIASPSTDGLGGSGIPATVDNRWTERLGGAYLLSFMKDAIAYETAKNAQTGGSVAGASTYQNTRQTSEDMATKVLSTTIGIKPVLYSNQGDRVGIYVARDLDFSKVYEVRTR